MDDLPFAADGRVEQPNNQPAAWQERATAPDNRDLTGGR
jgi:hypothetical protein